MSLWKRLTDRWSFRAMGTQMVEEFARKFPGRCLICSYHEYSISHGHVQPDTPVEPHDCIEASAARAAVEE